MLRHREERTATDLRVVTTEAATAAIAGPFSPMIAGAIPATEEIRPVAMVIFLIRPVVPGRVSE